jgi:hypothetical protein
MVSYPSMRRIQKENVSAQGKGGQRFVGMGKRGATRDDDEDEDEDEDEDGKEEPGEIRGKNNSQWL